MNPKKDITELLSATKAAKKETWNVLPNASTNSDRSKCDTLQVEEELHSMDRHRATTATSEKRTYSEENHSSSGQVNSHERERRMVVALATNFPTNG